jgi:hypothetical protein
MGQPYLVVAQHFFCDVREVVKHNPDGRDCITWLGPKELSKYRTTVLAAPWPELQSSQPPIAHSHD